MKNSIIKLSLFKEAFRQLKIVGIAAFVISILISVLVPIRYKINYSRMILNGEYNSTFEFYTGMEWLVCVFYIVIPIMMLVMFSFNNKRNGCDLYHAAPVKRTTLYFSLLSAVLAWAFILIAASTVVFTFMMKVLPGITMGTDYMVMFLVAVIAGCFFVTGAFAIGVSVTGTLFTNMVVTLMILVIPRTILLLVQNELESMAPLLALDYYNNLFSNWSNIVFSYVISVVNSNTNVLYGWGSCIFTLVMGVIYSGLGYLAFKKRKSEAASSPSLNPVFQTIFRLIPSYIISFIGTAMLLEMIYGYATATEVSFFVVVLYIISVVVYFMYELITTRKWSRVLKSARELPILLALNIVTFCVLFFTAKVSNNYSPAAADTEYVRILGTNSYSYVIDVNPDIKLTTDKAIDTVVDAYNRTADTQQRDYVYEYGYTYDTYVDYADAESYYQCVVEINNGHISHYRYVNFTAEELLTLTKEVMSSDEFIKDGKKYLPKLSDLNSIYDTKFSLESFEINQIYKCLYNEIKRNNNLMDVLETDENDSVDELQIQFGNRSSNSWFTIPISYKTPETVKLLQKLVNTSNMYSKYIEPEKMDMIFSDKYNEMNANVSFYLYDGVDSWNNYYTYSSYVTDYYSSDSILKNDIVSNLNEQIKAFSTKEGDGDNILIYSRECDFTEILSDDTVDYQNYRGMNIYYLTDEQAENFISQFNLKK